MKKIAALVFVLFVTSSLFGEDFMKGCTVVKLNDASSIYSCASGDYLVNYTMSGSSKNELVVPEVKVLASRPQQIIQATQSK